MVIPSKKLKNGFKMPVLGIGTAGMYDEKKDIDSIKAAIEMGYTHIDTAEVYGGGSAERNTGEAIQNYNRNKLFITSKVWKNHLKFEELVKACKNSLDRLQTDYLDLYLLHAPNPQIPLKETMAALDFLVDEGLILNFGVSNFTSEQIKEAQGYAQNAIVNNQIHLNIASQEPDNVGALNYCQEYDILVTAYSPLEQGILADDREDLGKLAKKYQKTPVQIAINWLISQKNVVTIVKASKIEHLKENLGALDWELTQEDVESLKENI